MPLKFNNDAICLSGILGTKLKSRIIHKYYNLWWKITSGGPKENFSFSTAIIEMNAGTGELYVEETDEFILGSAGSAMDLKFNNKYIHDPNLTIVLVEKDESCVEHLKNVINRRFPKASIIDKDIEYSKIKKECILIRKNVDEAIETINQMNIKGRCIYFFDPLLSVDMDPLRKVYEKYVTSPFIPGIEFIVFFFTSDWIFGRDEIIALPNVKDSDKWSREEKTTVELLNNVFGDDTWYNVVLNSAHQTKRIKNLINEYQKRLFEMFRFVVPMPFAPKEDQLYHLVFCSNFSQGTNIISRFYTKYTNNSWTPDNRVYYYRFKEIHRRDLKFPSGSKRPTEWKLLWNFIKNYNHGKFDKLSKEVKERGENSKDIDNAFSWLKRQNYIKKYTTRGYDGREIVRYELNWDEISKKLSLERPNDFEALKDEDFAHYLN